MAWRWTAMRLVISIFLVYHLTAIAAWNLPIFRSGDRLAPAFRSLHAAVRALAIVAVFAPDPMGETAVLESEVIDAKGHSPHLRIPQARRSSLVAKGTEVSPSEIHVQSDE